MGACPLVSYPRFSIDEVRRLRIGEPPQLGQNVEVWGLFCNREHGRLCQFIVHARYVEIELALEWTSRMILRTRPS